MMRRALVILAGLVLAGSGWAQTESRENYLPNPGFEAGLKYWEPGEGVGVNGSMTLDDKVKHSGKYSLRFDYKKNPDPRLSTFLVGGNHLGAILTPGKTYTMSGWIKIAGVPPGKSGPAACICAEWCAELPPVFSAAVSGNTNLAKNDGWVFVSFPYKVDKNAVTHTFLCWCCPGPGPGNGMEGTIWFDDLKLEEGEKPSAFREDWVDAAEVYSQEATVPWLPVPVDYRASTEIVTPHLEPAKPCAGGPMRLLWAGFNDNARMACELAERGDFAMDSVVFNGSSTDYAGVRTLHEKCIRVFRERLGVEPELGPDRGPQVLVIEQGTVELLNKRDCAAILGRVRQGMGCVVLLGPAYVPNHPAIATPKIKGLMDAAERMQEPRHGRVLTVLHPLQSPYWQQAIFGIEMTYSEIIKAAWRSVGRPPVPPLPVVAPQKPLSDEPWKVTVLGAGAAAQVRVVPDLPPAHVGQNDSIMDGYGVGVSRDAVAEASADIAEGATSATLALPPLPGGAYILEARLLDKDKRVLGWSLSKLAIASRVTVTKLDVGGAAFTMANQLLNAVCTIKNDAAPIEGAFVSAQVTDPLGRLLARFAPVPVPLKHGETSCSIPVALSHAELCSAKLLVEVKDKEKSLAQSEAWLSTEKLMPRVDFNVGPYDDYIVGARDLGADMVVDLLGRPDLGLRPYPWLDLLCVIGEESSTCDPSVLEKAKKYVIQSIAADAPLHIVGLILHDELDDFGFRSKVTERDIAFFRQYLKETYKTLDALNASWGAAYKDWGEINTEPTKINFITQGDRNPAPWADWNAASEQVAHRFYSALDDAVRQAHPEARIGPSGTRDTSGVNGIDWWLLTKDFRSVSLYSGIHDEMFRSFATPEHMVTRWSHLDALGAVDGIRARIWRDLLLQNTGTPTFGGHYSNLFFPDYRPKPGALSFFEELAAIRSGFGRLILGAKRDDRAAAIFYSPACCRAQIAQKQKRNAYTVLTCRAYNDSLASLSGALDDLRIGSHFIAYEQVSRGELKPGTPKALFLWGALALTEAEAAAIRQYADAGGVVIADQEPGVYDEHCHKLAQGRLHDLMPAPGAASQAVGKGKFLLFTGLPDNYAQMQGYGVGGEGAQAVKNQKGEVTAKFLAVLEAQTDLQPRFRITDPQGPEITKDLAAFAYTDGAARYVACIPEGKHGETLKARLTVLGNGHLYECRTGKYLGAAAPQDLELHLATANIFALLPYKVEKLQLTAPATAALGQPIHVKAALQTGAGQPVRHVIVVQLRRPDGKETPVNRWILETMNRAVEADFFLALNDPAGKWTLVVFDAATGVRQEQPIELRGDSTTL